MPAAAVIPAPIAYIKIVAVKKLVVGFQVVRIWPVSVTSLLPVCACLLSGEWLYLHWSGSLARSFTLKKLECLKQACCYEYISME